MLGNHGEMEEGADGSWLKKSFVLCEKSKSEVGSRLRCGAGVKVLTARTLQY